MSTLARRALLWPLVLVASIVLGDRAAVLAGFGPAQGQATGSGGATPGWPGVLAVNANTAGHNPTITSGDTLTVLSGATITSPDSAGSSEKFGAGASATGASDTAVGNGCVAGSGGNNTCMGQGLAGGTSLFTVMIGDGIAGSGANSVVALGHSMNAAGANRSIGIGASGTINATTDAIAVGFGATPATDSMCFGTNSTSAAGQFVAGSDLVVITDVYFGAGAASATPPSFVTYHATGGTGAAVSGSSVRLGPGVGGDNASPASLRLAAAVTGSATTLTDLVYLDGPSGSVGVGGAPGAYGTFTLDVSGSTGARVMNLVGPTGPGQDPLYISSEDGSLASTPGVGSHTGRLRYLDGTGWQVAADGIAANAYVTIGGGGSTYAISPSGGTASNSGANSFAGGTSASAGAAGATAFGVSAVASGTNSTVVGNQATDSAASYGVAIGYTANASGGSSIAIGAGPVATAATGGASIAIGNDTQAGGNDAICIGPSSSTSRAASIVIGFSSSDGGFSALVFGEALSATAAGQNMFPTGSVFVWGTHDAGISEVSSSTVAFGNGAVNDETGVGTFGAVSLNVISSTSGPVALPLSSAHNNNGALVSVTFSLPLTPTAASGTQSFRVTAGQTVTVQAPNGVTLYVGTAASSSGGTFSTNLVGSTVTFEYQGSSVWEAIAVTGVWTPS